MEQDWKQYSRDVQSFLERLKMGRIRWHVPEQVKLYHRIPNAQFHTTPEIFFQTGGATDFECPGGNFRSETGDICIMPRGTPHKETAVDLETPYSILVCVYRPTGTCLIRARSPGNGKVMGHSADPLVSQRCQQAFLYLDHIAEIALNRRAQNPELVSVLLESFLLTFLMELESPEPAGKRNPSRIAQALQLIQANLSDPKLSVAGLAAAMKCSPDHLTRLFREEKKLGVASWIQKQRIELAQELLKNREYNISEVAWACGYNTTSYFVEIFKRYTDLTPGQYRAQHAL